MVVRLYRIIYYLHVNNVLFIPSVLNYIFIRILFSCQIGLGAKLGRNVFLGYGGLGTVIHHRVDIGDNVLIGTGVTIGGTGKKYEVPIIGENTMISTGAKIIGPIKIGKNCVIGANAVVLTDIPDNSLVLGVPGRIIKSNIDIKKYR